MSMQRLKGKVAVITGGARGIGRAAVETYVREGAAVAIWDVVAEAGEALVKELTAAGGNAAFFKVDVTQLADVEAATQAVLAKFGQIDVLVNNAGITRDASLAKMTPEQWQQVLDVNLTGVFNCTKAISAHMVTRGMGSIINTSSIVGVYGNIGQTNYVATKAGLIGMTKTWSKELGRKGVRVNAVAPGFIATEMIGTIPEKIIQTFIDRTPLGRTGQPQDIANAYLWLASDEASFVNGQVLGVDGGLVM